MLCSTNHIISIQSLSTGAKRTWTEVDSDVAVYINQTQEEVLPGFDNNAAFMVYRMMTDGNHEDIFINDRIVDENDVTYEVKGKSISDDMMWIHHQYILLLKQT